VVIVVICVDGEVVSDLLLQCCLSSDSGVGGCWTGGSLLASSVRGFILDSTCGLSSFVLAAGFSSCLSCGVGFLPTAASIGVTTAAGVAGPVSIACSGTTSSTSLLALRDSCPSETTL